VRLFTRSSVYYSIQVQTNIPVLEGWEASFDRGATWKPGEIDPNNPGYWRWLVYGPTFLTTVGTSITPVPDTPVIPEEGITPIVRLIDDPLIIIGDAPRIEVYDNDDSYTGLVSIDEFRRFMNNMNFNEQQRIAAQQLLRGAQGQLEQHLNRSVQLVQVREYAQVDVSGYLNLTVSPIWKIIKAERTNDIAGADIFPPQVEPYTPDPLERDPMIGTNGRTVDLTSTSFGSPTIVPGGIYVGSLLRTWYFVEYVAGYNGANDDALKVAIMQVASRSMEIRHDDTLSLRSEGATQAAQSDVRPVNWTDEELNSLDRLRRRVIA
jgi:hypothetical protein